ncbi:ABC transporter substrate-binding protein [Actinopolymorpha singaporensis]
MGDRRRHLTRRDLLLSTGGAALAATSLVGCDLLSTDPTSRSKGKPSGVKGKEAPSLAAQVKAGRLPAVKDRLPARPLVLRPAHETDSYGGTWKTFIQGIDGSSVYENIGYDPLVRWAPDFSGVIPNIVSWEVDADGRDYVFHLRKGMRWSDGRPFTADDIAFAFEDVLSNEELFPVFPEWLAPGGKPARFTKVDDVTCRFSFAEPHAFFLERLASPEGNILAASPKHYLKTFHKKYNPDLDKLVRQAKLTDWNQLYFGKGGDGTSGLAIWQNPDLPVLLPWVVATPLTKDRLVAKRNPYYWKTDPDGSQLPYLDEVVVEVVTSPETAVLKVSNGEYTLPSTDILTPSNKPVFARSTDKGDYRLINQMTSDINNGVVCLNLTHKDPVTRKLFQNKDFRIGLSYAINRAELIKAVHQRQGKPYQSAPRPESDFYDEKMATQYTKYDVAEANRRLDSAGLTRRDSAGWRLRPDGRRVAFTVELPTGFDPTYPATAELVQNYWKAVGVQLRVQAQGGPLFWKRLFANEHDAVLYSAENGLRDAILDPGWFFPIGGRCYYARQWADWYATGGRSGEKPPAAPHRQMELYDTIKVTMDEKKRRRLFAEVLRISAEEFYTIGTVLIAGRYSIVQNKIRNVPEPIPEGSLYPDPAPAGPEQFYLRT